MEDFKTVANGGVCADCGRPFVQCHGYQVSCDKCYWDLPEEKRSYRAAACYPLVKVKRKRNPTSRGLQKAILTVLIISMILQLLQTCA